MIFVSLLLFTIGNHFYLIDQPGEYAGTEIKTTKEVSTSESHEEIITAEETEVANGSLIAEDNVTDNSNTCLLYTSPSPRD